MKKKTFLMLAIVIALITIIACSKSLKDSTENQIVSKKKPTPLSIKLDYSKKQTGRDISEVEGGDFDICAGHGGSIGIGQSWDMATCKSGCERGIGFRCGSQKYIKCNDGTHIPIGTVNNHCPKSTLVAAERSMDGDFVFFDDNTLKIIFKKMVPESEQENTNFEIEFDETIDLPSFISIGGIIYSGYRVYEGVYQIDYNDSEFGSVVIPITLVP